MLPAAAPPAVVPSPPAAVDPVHPGALLRDWLAVAAGVDDLAPRLLRLPDGRVLTLPVARWAAAAGVADQSMLARADGPVLDVGCGPGRLTAALHARGVDVLGLELVEEIPVLVRAAGAPLVLGDVFGPVPRAGEWRTVLLADGNVGIGGDPARILRRLHGLLAPRGRVLVELHPGTPPPAGRVRLETLGTTSEWFSWALLGAAALPAAARAAGLDVDEAWSCEGREFAALVAA